MGHISDCIHFYSKQTVTGEEMLLVTVPLVVLDLATLVWVFIALKRTTKTLRERGHLDQLWRYRYFTGTLIAAIALE